MTTKYKVTYTFKQDNGFLNERTVKFHSFIEAFKYAQNLSNTHVGNIVGKPVVHEVGHKVGQ